MTDSAETVTAEEARLKRLRLRSWRRGIKEMDLILGPWADAELPGMDDAALTAYEALLEENDWDLYYWVTGARETPDTWQPLIGRIAAWHGTGRD